MARVTLRGRAAEMSAAPAALRTASRTRRGILVALVGEPGIGKTSLLREVAEQARRQGFTIGTGKTEEIDQIAPGAPLLVALRSGAQPLLDAATFAGPAPLSKRPLWLVDRVAELLAQAAARQPVLIGLDDVQWADPLTRFALRLLPSRLAGSPLVWMLTSRLAPIDHLEEILAAADPAVPVERVDLGPIGIADLEALAADRLAAPPDPTVRRLLQGVGGNPFWAGQLLAGLTRRRARGLPETGLHTELITSVRQRMSALPELPASVVRAVAVYGRPVPAERVAALLDDATAELVYEVARHAENEGLLTVEEAGLALPHDLIREAVHAHLPPAERRRLHRARGRQLVAAGATALSAAPHFLASAGSGDIEAVEVALRAAAESVTLVPEQAALLARQAFELVGPAHPGVQEIGQRALAVLVDAQRDSDVLDLADTLLPLATDPADIARIEVNACRAVWETGAGLELERRTGVALTRPGVPEIHRARLTALRTLAFTRTPSAPAAARAATDALAEGARLGDVLTQRTALHALTEATRNVGEHQKVLDYFDRLDVISPGAHGAERIRALQHLDRYEDAAALLARARRDAGGNLDRMLPSYLYAQAWQHHNLGEIDAAEASARELLRQAEAIANWAYTMNARVILCALDIYRGDLSRAGEALAPIKHAAESRETLRASRLRLMQAWLTAEEGHPARALRIAGPRSPRRTTAVTRGHGRRLGCASSPAWRGGPGTRRSPARRPTSPISAPAATPAWPRWRASPSRSAATSPTTPSCCGRRSPRCAARRGDCWSRTRYATSVTCWSHRAARTKATPRSARPATSTTGSAPPATPGRCERSIPPSGRATPGVPRWPGRCTAGTPSPRPRPESPNSS